MTEISPNDTATVWPFLLVVVLCVFWLLASSLQGRMSGDGKKSGGPHASWRASEVAAPLRRFWQSRRRGHR
jgi:hypothetical protein